MISKFLLIANFLIVIFTVEVSDGDRSNHQDMHRQLKVKNNYCNISFPFGSFETTNNGRAPLVNSVILLLEISVEPL